jgi:type VI secretion system secreted protein VgrG
MAPALKQQSRTAELKTPLGKDELVITRLDGSEGLSELFTFNIDALSETEDVDFDAALGAKCTVSVTSNDNTRHFNGILVEAQWTGRREHLYSYRLVLRPWLWLLSRVSDCRIFANKTAPEIISDIFSKHGFATFEKKLTENYTTLEYYVQYRETDLDFVTRIMEEFGIYYFFRHEDGQHTLVLADAKSSHRPLPGGGMVPYRPGTASRRREEHLSHWVPGRRFNTGRVVLNDYDYLKPSASLLSESESASGYQNSKLETFDYPGRYVEKSDGERYARVRLEAEQASDNRRQGAGTAVSLFPGALVSLKDHPTKSQNKEYLVVRATHSVATESFRSGPSMDDEETYSGRYEFLPSDKPFRAPMLTPKPVVRGPQTAKVVGDGEIDVDKHGRIIVQFHWDRNKDESRRVRIGQVWSGKKWGGIFIPRVGMEVIVEFLEGDPDRPLVVGTVYNDDYKPPYDLPGDKNIAGWKSRSTEGGGEQDYNEVIFDDTEGSELIRIHAQKDMETTVENDDSQTVKNDRTITVEGKHDETIYRSTTIESYERIELKVGTSKITMTPASISIDSTMITINANANLTATSPLTTVTGSVTLTLLNNVIITRLNGGTPVITL